MRRRSPFGAARAARLLVTPDRIARIGRSGWALAAQLDMLRSIGVRAMLDRREDWAATSALLAQRMESMYLDFWTQAASAAGAVISPMDDGFLAISRGDQRTIVRQRHVMLDSPVALALAGNKSAMYASLGAAGIPVPEHIQIEFPDLAPAEEFRREAEGTCVVKPAQGTSGGFGVTCGVTTSDDLLRACMRAARWDPHIIVEAQTRGTEYRALVLDGRVLDVVRRSACAVTADGMSDIAELIATENERRRTSNGRLGYSHIGIDLDCVLALRRQGLTLRSVPARDTRVEVKSSANDSGPAETETLPDVPAELARTAIVATRTVGLRFAGVELITSDPTVPLSVARGTVIEVNGAPGLQYHYQVRNPERATPVATLVLERLLA
jgi:D-alanine-D-alanine ligase-like ATP-grasp enzyme